MEINKFADYKALIKIDMNKVIHDVVLIEDVQKAIIDYIQKEQLKQGIDGNDRRIETIASKEQGGSYPYSRYTVAKRGARGLQVNNVDLEYTGAFYNTFDVEVRNDEFEPIADFSKPDGDIRDNFDSSYDFLKLTKNSLQNLSDWLLLTYISDYIKRWLTK